ncbi:porin [Grimontia hollisae]|uniref:Outer membrane porin protein n=1 Tax=Grimontia hollisae CIP 101886 TaxID=675812 RepID=D0ICD5_GRIHO|nr:porin [Grimontia hollisae]AMG29927.1 porin [Grimontia hollisae]EEY71553.1 outer membrane porin protein [Grimontia hollisae CIP 101886]STO43045.1 Outer membrane pore protein E precursor [Grimontia hollisae]
MEIAFKRSLLGMAVAVAAVSCSANAAIDLHGEAVQLYGQAAGFMHLTNPEVGDSAAQAVIESRVGFKGRVAFDDFGPDFIWQIESGDANNTDYGAFGMRDTFLGLDFDGVGSFKFGRQLIAAYNYVDWPHSNPGLGNVFDWHNALGEVKDGKPTGIAFEDRANNVFRFDSATWGGFNFQATLSGMGSTTDALVASIATSYSTDIFSVHAGYYDQGKYTVDVAATDPSWVYNKDKDEWESKPGTPKGTKEAGDISYAIVGGSVFLGDVTLTAAWKHMENGLTDNSQDAYSATAQYVIDGTWVLKAGYAATSDTDKGIDDGSQAITGRLGYLLPSTYLYMDVRSYDYYGANEDNDGTNILIGAEYYF